MKDVPRRGQSCVEQGGLNVICLIEDLHLSGVEAAAEKPLNGLWE